MVTQTEHIIIVENLVKKFGDFIANDNLSFSVKSGEIFGFLGANGAGKTTALKILSGLSLPSSGKVLVAGYNVYKEREKVKKNIGYMSQKFSLYEDLSVKENIRFYGGIYGLSSKYIRKKTTELLTRLKMEDIRDKAIKSLPLGWKQKIAFSVAVFHEPKIVFLDEPTGGVDPITRRDFWEMIYEASYNGITVFVTTHYMDEAEYCDRVCIMERGKIEAIGAPTALKNEFNVQNMDDVFLKIAR
ncbi:MAG: ABC transporter ATP-binding protein [Bacteroidales bacterium]|jgi:ABC-2 type transport system ATP-binding protein|nr:ABC transporter ATP-binding protein [Bacteroidales bacterium]